MEGYIHSSLTSVQYKFNLGIISHSTLKLESEYLHSQELYATISYLAAQFQEVAKQEMLDLV
jgi:hypothetical protein